MVTSIPLAAEERITLPNVRWSFYETLLQEVGEHRTVRIAYDRGTLELMSPLSPHERSKRLLEKLIDALLEELDQPAVSVGSMTCKRQDLDRGAEPDTGYYIQQEQAVRTKETIDLNIDPPPDLVLEVEYSSPAIDKLDLYAALGIPELWRYDGQSLRLYQLQQGQYRETQTSLVFPSIPLTELPRFLQTAKQMGELVMIKQFRAWIHTSKILTSRAGDLLGGIG